MHVYLPPKIIHVITMLCEFHYVSIANMTPEAIEI